MEEIKEKLGFKAVGRKIMGDEGQNLELRDPLALTMLILMVKWAI